MTELRVTRDLVDTLTADVRRFGARNAETGGFLLSTEAQPDRLTVLALAGQDGIGRRRGLFTVSGTAIERLFSWAGERELRIRAQVHSHAHDAFLSPTDLRHGFNVAEFITAVVPYFAAPSPEPVDWGWWQRSATAWLTRPAPTVVVGAVTAVHFDQAGIHAA
jgi:hypothetical protein